MLRSISLLVIAFTILCAEDAAAGGQERKIMLINMGGNDCPPCLAWNANDLPKLKASPLFPSITYVHVEKFIKSPVPPRFFFPDNAKHLVDKLDVASSGLVGSPQWALVVDDEVYDYWWGTRRTVADLEAMIRSVREGTEYPFERCLQRESRTECKVVAR